MSECPCCSDSQNKRKVAELFLTFMCFDWSGNWVGTCQHWQPWNHQRFHQHCCSRLSFPVTTQFPHGDHLSFILCVEMVMVTVVGTTYHNLICHTVTLSREAQSFLGSDRLPTKLRAKLFTLVFSSTLCIKSTTLAALYFKIHLNCNYWSELHHE